MLLAMSSNWAIFAVVFFKGFLQLLIHSSFTEFAFNGLSDRGTETVGEDGTVDEDCISAGKEIVLFLPVLTSTGRETRFKGILLSLHDASSCCWMDFITASGSLGGNEEPVTVAKANGDGGIVDVDCWETPPFSDTMEDETTCPERGSGC